MRHRRSIATCAIGITFLGAAIALWAWPVTTTEAPDESRDTIVEIARVEAGTATRTVRLSGVTRAKRRAALSFAVPARVATRPVELGDRVHRGTVLATLDEPRLCWWSWTCAWPRPSVT